MALPALAAAPVVGQELAGRITGEDGTVAFRYATRPGVEVCDRAVRLDGGRTTMGRWRERWEDHCVEGAAQVVLSVRGGRVRAVELEPPGEARTDRFLGTVSAPLAADFLLGLAEDPDGDDRAAEEAMLPAMIADSVETWPRLLALGRDRDARRKVRESALFWVSRAAAGVVTEGLSEVARDERDDSDVRKAAVFALSRRPEDEGVPALMEIARTAPDPEVRESALFWLARADDPRVIPFFEEILLGARRGGG